MSKYSQPPVIYRGYMIPMEKFTTMMKKIPAYRRLMATQYGEHSHVFCYCHWKHAILDEKLKKRAPKVRGTFAFSGTVRPESLTMAFLEEHSAIGADRSVEGTHMMLLVGYIPFKSNSQVEDPAHPCAVLLEEKDTDREAIAQYVRFFQKRGIKDLKTEDFTFGWSIGSNPCLLTVRIPDSTHFMNLLLT